MRLRQNFSLFIFASLLILIGTTSCSHNQKQNTEESASRDIAQAAKTIYAEFKVASGLFDDAVKLQLDDLFRNQTVEVQAIEKLGVGKSADFALKGSSSSARISFIKNTTGDNKLVLKNNTGKDVVLANSVRINFDLSAEQIKKSESKFVSTNSNGKEVVEYVRPGTKGSAELVRVGDTNYSGGGAVWGKKQEAFEQSAYYRSVAAELEKEGLSEADSMILDSLKKLKFEAVTVACGKLTESSKETMAIILDDLAKSQSPREKKSLILSYAKAVKITNPEEAEQLIEILRSIDCGLNIGAFI